MKKFASESGLFGTIALLAPGYADAVLADERQVKDGWFKFLVDMKMDEVWDDDTSKFKEKLLIKGETWQPVSLFDLPPLTGRPGERVKVMEQATAVAWSPSRRFFYCNHLLPRGDSLVLFQNRRRGLVWFTTDVIHPTLGELQMPGHRQEVWMGLTPGEVLSQRQGIRRATGRVVVGGMGLGWFLNKVCQKPSVKEVILVEREQELIDWLMPRIVEKYPATAKTQVVCADVYAFMEADVDNQARTRYLLDIWPDFGCCDAKFYAWKGKLGKHIWGWGDVWY